MTSQSPLYDTLSKATGVPRDDVKKVAHALAYCGTTIDANTASLERIADAVETIASNLSYLNDIIVNK